LLEMAARNAPRHLQAWAAACASAKVFDVIRERNAVHPKCLVSDQPIPWIDAIRGYVSRRPVSARGRQRVFVEHATAEIGCSTQDLIRGLVALGFRRSGDVRGGWVFVASVGM
jgi:hypothetical protein